MMRGDRLMIKVKTDSTMLEQAVKYTSGVINRILRTDLTALKEGLEKGEIVTTTWQF